ncbi:hypothetical protein MSAN_01072800 [Mycena sanguinolenta]|uniref:Uncharacterized protein n=1 Tax=Mycena sanguinolenta TaxID=230812 RepID=A0A8H7D9Z1_9AGAR|nr:hypothetical protein MSAN_01072800 [Mycena sanguinolenta]
MERDTSSATSRATFPTCVRCPSCTRSLLSSGTPFFRVCAPSHSLASWSSCVSTRRGTSPSRWLFLVARMYCMHPASPNRSSSGCGALTPPPGHASFTTKDARRSEFVSITPLFFFFALPGPAEDSANRAFVVRPHRLPLVPSRWHIVCCKCAGVFTRLVARLSCGPHLLLLHLRQHHSAQLFGCLCAYVLACISHLRLSSSSFPSTHTSSREFSGEASSPTPRSLVVMSDMRFDNKVLYCVSVAKLIRACRRGWDTGSGAVVVLVYRASLTGCWSDASGVGWGGVGGADADTARRLWGKQGCRWADARRCDWALTNVKRGVGD